MFKYLLYMLELYLNKIVKFKFLKLLDKLTILSSILILTILDKV